MGLIQYLVQSKYRTNGSRIFVYTQTEFQICVFIADNSTDGGACMGDRAHERIRRRGGGVSQIGRGTE